MAMTVSQGCRPTRIAYRSMAQPVKGLACHGDIPLEGSPAGGEVRRPPLRFRRRAIAFEGGYNTPGGGFAREGRAAPVPFIGGRIMRRLVGMAALVAVAGLVGLARADDKANVTGTWKWTVEFGGQTR